nr:hypothetical protein [Tanacetum cinerariifolium]
MHTGDKQYALLTHQKPQQHMVPTVVLTQSKPVFNTAVRPVSAAVPRLNVTRPRLAHPTVTKSKSPIRRHISHSPSSKTNNSPLRVITVQAPVVSDAQGMQGNWGNPQYALKDNRVIDSGCLRHMTRNMSYLSDFEELNGGYVAFGGNPKGGKISGKGKIKTGNLVRGLPTKFFENDNTCVACKKGKQHRASCMTKPVSSVDQPLFRPYMNLFGPTFVKSLNKKSYCLVITNDYSRFTWVFFLATKDETSPILKIFITGIENQLSLKGIKREFSVPRTPQQNGIAERKNRTLIEAARPMLADSLLPILFWAEAINAACYVQNRVLVTKPHNKTPYELLHGRTPSIGFIRPFGCPVTILNTLDPLGKFEGKVDEGFLVRYYVCSKAFRVFNSRTRIIQETLHVNFLENKHNVAGSGPTWLFNIDSLTRTMNYQPVIARNQTNPSAGFQDKFDAKKAGEEIDQQYLLFPIWSSGSTNPQNNGKDAAFDDKEHDFDAKKHESEVILSPSSSAQSRKQDDKTKKEAKGKSHVESFTGYRDLNAEFNDFFNNSSNEVNAAGSIVPTVRQNSLNNTNTFSAAELEDITYSDDEDDLGAEADFNNLESSISIGARHFLPYSISKDKGVIDSGCSRHMTGNMSYLSNFEELNGGYVTFGGNPKGGKIFDKGKIKTCNLVRGLPTKVFENANTCVACKKGKQHRASCKTKPDETSPILKSFITGLENQLSLKVKVIRSDNGTEFKNFDLNQFCRMKGIKREFSVPRTPQQNGITERKNKTLTEAARTILADSLLPIPFWTEANYDGGAAFDGKEHDSDVKQPESEVNVSPSSNLSAKFQDCSENISNEVNAAGTIVATVGQHSLNSTNPFITDGPSNTTASPTHGQSSLKDASQPTDDLDMPELKDITYSDNDNDVGAEADFNNLETSITVSPIPTTRIHKDHPVSQSIGDLSSTTQTRRRTQEGTSSSQRSKLD